MMNTSWQMIGVALIVGGAVVLAIVLIIRKLRKPKVPDPCSGCSSSCDSCPFHQPPKI